MSGSWLRLQVASADLPAVSQVWHPGREGHRLVLLYEKCCFGNYPASHTHFFTEVRWKWTKEHSSFSPSLLQYWSQPGSTGHIMWLFPRAFRNFSSRFQQAVYFPPKPVRQIPNLSNVSFWRSKASCNSRNDQWEACCSRFLAVRHPGYSRAGSGEDHRNLFCPPSISCLQLGGLSSRPFQCWKGARGAWRTAASHLSYTLASLRQLAITTTCSVQTSLGNFSWKTENSIKHMQTGFSSACNTAKFEHSFRELVQCVFLTESCLLPNFACSASKH